MEWQEISSAETAAAGNAPEMVDDTIYESICGIENKMQPK